MTGFDKAIDFVLSHEGGYSNDPNDPGGETRWGISKRSHPELDIANLTREQAVLLYKTDYWDKCRCGEMPFPIALLVMDSSVNQGPDAAIRMLQASLDVNVDGKLGPVTIGAIQRAAISRLLCEFVAERAFRYAINPNVRRYGRGWFARLASCHQSANEPF